MILSYVDSSWDAIYNKMSEDLNAIKWWFSNNKLVLSVEKTTFINFSLRKSIQYKENVLYKCDNCSLNNRYCHECAVIKRSTSTKYLGIILDSELNWKAHILKLKHKLISNIRLFYFLKKMCPKQILRTLYYALINSKLEYGVVLWGGTYVTNLKVLINAQKLFVRLILGRNRFSSSHLCFVELNILPLRS